MSRAKFAIIITVVFFCLVFAELATSVFRGYGLVTISRMSSPERGPMQDLGKIRSYAMRAYNELSLDCWPSAESVDDNVAEVDLAGNQPYSDYGIWVFKSTTYNEHYLYARSDIRDDETYWDDPNYCGIVAMCNAARWEGPSGTYHPFKKYPAFVRDYIDAEMGGEKWTCWNTGGGLGSVRCDCPPIPGARLFMLEPRKYSGPLNVKYPVDILPLVRTIYPNLLIDEGNVLRK